MDHSVMLLIHHSYTESIGIGWVRVRVRVRVRVSIVFVPWTPYPYTSPKTVVENCLSNNVSGSNF